MADDLLLLGVSGDLAGGGGGGTTYTALDPAKTSGVGALSLTDHKVTYTGDGISAAVAPCVAAQTCFEVHLDALPSAVSIWLGFATGDATFSTGIWAGAENQVAGDYMDGVTWAFTTNNSDDRDSNGISPPQGADVMVECNYLQTKSGRWTAGADDAPQGCWRIRWNGNTGFWWPLPTNDSGAAVQVYAAVGGSNGGAATANFGPTFVNSVTPGFSGIVA